MLMIAVCDDEIRECYELSIQIQHALDQLNMPCTIRQYHSGQELLQAKQTFDIVFLDIIMQGMDGMKTAELFRRKFNGKILIFISSSRQYVFDAFAVEAFEYLVKPIAAEKLRGTLSRCIAKIGRQSDDFIILSKDRKVRKLFLDEVRYFEICGRQIEAHGADSVFSWYEQISALEKALSGKDFFRCHKSYLVNLKYVDYYDRHEVTLDNGDKILIAKRRYEAFCTAILSYMRRNGGIAAL